jgi:PGF-CTERM protein
MQRERILVGVAVALIVVSLLAAILVPGALADRTEEEPDGRVAVEEIAIGADNVGGERLDLVTDVRLEHWGGPSDNITVELRAVGLDSGLIATSETLQVGGVDDDRELAVQKPLTVQRGGDYRVEAIVYQNGVRVTTGSKAVRGTGALTPGYPDSPVEFHRFARHDLPAVEYSIQESTNESATLGVETYLTNSGNLTADNLQLVVKARQVDSGIVASEQEVSVDAVGPSQTARPQTELTVPAQYNYYLDAILWKDGVVVDTARAGANLDPSEEVSEDVEERDVELEVGDFDESQDDPSDRGDTPTPIESGDGSGPGFGIVAALVALLVGTLIARYRDGGTQ